VIVARSVSEARAALRSLPRPLGFTPTMGALHSGHLALVAAAKSRCASVVASLFVNPTQFGAGEDLDKYPRDEAHDLKLFREAGVEVVFAPRADDMYPQGFATLVHVGGQLTESFEGLVRGSHFDGVATIVAKLLGVVQPDVLFLGQKDAQQLAVLRRMTRDLNLPVQIAAVPTVREPDGLALSSRNAYLTSEQRAIAPSLFRALHEGRAAAQCGALPHDIVATTISALSASTDPPLFGVDYVAVVDAGTFARESIVGSRSLLIAAVRLGTTRLIDNLSLATDPGPAAPREPSPSASSTEASAYPAEDATN
jgi:pantoate--beta-alanine ligase